MADRPEGDGDERHPFGPGSHGPLPDVGELPACYLIKGTTDDDRRLYHRPDSSEYDDVRAEVWFDSPSMAEAAGFELSSSHPPGSSGEDFEPGAEQHPCTGQEVQLYRLRAEGRTVAPPLAAPADADGAVSRAAGARDAGTGDAGTGDAGARNAGSDRAEPGQLAADPDRHPYGVGSHAPLSDLSEMPRFYPIKGRVESDGARWYHRPDSSVYRTIEAAVWFDAPTAAEAAGFELAETHPSGSSSDDFEPGGSDHGWTSAEVHAARQAASTGDRELTPPVSSRLAAAQTPTEADTDLDAEADGEMSADVGADTDAGADGERTADLDTAADGDRTETADAGDGDGDAGDGDEDRDEDDTLPLGRIAGAGTAAIVGAGAAALAGRDDGSGLPDLEDAATDVSHSRIVGEDGESTAQAPAGGHAEQPSDAGIRDAVEITSPSPAGGRIGGTADVIGDAVDDAPVDGADGGPVEGAGDGPVEGAGEGAATSPSPAGGGGRAMDAADGTDADSGDVTSPSPATAAGAGASGREAEAGDDAGPDGQAEADSDRDDVAAATAPAAAGAAGVTAAALAASRRQGGRAGDETKVASDAAPPRPTRAGGRRSAPVASSAAESGRRGVGRLLWAVFVSLALLTLLALGLSQCGGAETAADGSDNGGSNGAIGSTTADDGSTGAGAESTPDPDWTGTTDDADGTATGEGSGDAGRDDTNGTASENGTDGTASENGTGDSAGGDSAGGDSTTAGSSGSTDGSTAAGGTAEDDGDGSADADGDGVAGAAADVELEALALATLEDAGLGDLDVEVEDGVLRLVGDVESQEEADAAVAAIESMQGMDADMTVESALVVGVATGDDTGPEPVEEDPPLTG